MKYSAHINVEVCNTVVAVKYLYKYCFKGHDSAVFSLHGSAEESKDVDETKRFLNARYISASEAVWRILEFDIQGLYPNVVRLPVHLEDMNDVSYIPEQAEEALQRGKDTHLTRYFEHVLHDDFKLDPPPSQLLYHEFPKYYTWNKNLRNWTRKKRSLHSIGRMYSAHPSNMERYCLRLLLATVRGATSFSSLRTFEGIQYLTYQEACYNRGLLPSDEQCRKTMEETDSFCSPAHLRDVFATLLIFASMSSPVQIYEHFKDSLCADFTRNISEGSLYGNPEDYALSDLAERLQSHDKTLEQFGLPVPCNTFNLEHDAFSEHLHEHDSDLLSADSINSEISNMNEDQSALFQYVQECFDREEGNLIFIDAPGGTGKTFTFNTILKWTELRHGSGSTISVASSGVSSLLLFRGRTAHSTFKFPLHTDSRVNCAIGGKSDQADRIRKAKIIIWDEVCPSFTPHNIIIG
jgi:hypothetical protein